MKRRIVWIACLSLLCLFAAGYTLYRVNPPAVPDLPDSTVPRGSVVPGNVTPSPEQPKAGVSPSETAPADSTKTVRLVVMADSRGDNRGVNTRVVKAIMEKIKKLSPQPLFAVMPGDLVDGAQSYPEVKRQLEFFKKTMTGYYPPEFYYPGLGNHEVMHKSGGEKAFGEVFTEFKATFLEGYNRTVYYFDCGNTRFFMLNSDFPGETHRIAEKQLKWVRDNLDSSRKHTLFFVHEPPFPTGSGIGSSLDANRLLRDRLWDLVDQAEGPMVFCGHEHYYTRRHIDAAFNEKVNGTEFKYEKTVYQVTAGSFGAPLYKQYASKRNVDVPPVSKYHFAVVDIGEQIAVTVYDLDGKVIDRFRQ